MSAVLRPTELTDEQREALIKTTGLRMIEAYQRFQANGRDEDRQEAKRLLAEQTQLVRERSPAQIQRMERELDEGIDFFGARGAADRAKLGVARP